MIYYRLNKFEGRYTKVVFYGVGWNDYLYQIISMSSYITLYNNRKIYHINKNVLIKPSSLFSSYDNHPNPPSVYSKSFMYIDDLDDNIRKYEDYYFKDMMYAHHGLRND